MQSFESLRHNAIALLALLSLGSTGLSLLWSGLLTSTLYSFSIHALSPPEIDGRLGEWFARLAWMFDVAWCSGVLALIVLAFSFIFNGKEALNRRSWVWWALLAPLGFLIIAAIGGRYLPFVDVYSNTENFFIALGKYAIYGRGSLIWLCIALLMEAPISSHALSKDLAVTKFFGLRFSRDMPYFVGSALLLTGVCVAEFARGKFDYSKLQQGHDRSAICDATHAIVGQPRDFEVVREKYCWGFDDSSPNAPSDTLNRCESLQFKVDVVAQLWPPSQIKMPPNSYTLQISGVRQRVSYLKSILSQGERKFDKNHREIPSTGPSVFVGKMTTSNGQPVLRNSMRGFFYSTPASTRFPTQTENPLAICGAEYRKAEAIRENCYWDHSVIATAKSFEFIPMDSRVDPRVGAGVLVYNREGGTQHQLNGEKNEQQTNMIEVFFEVDKDLMPEKPAPKQFKVRFQLEGELPINNPQEFFLGRERPHKGVFLIRRSVENKNVYELMDTKDPRYGGRFPPGSDIDIQKRDTNKAMERCRKAGD